MIAVTPVPDKTGLSISGTPTKAALSLEQSPA